MGDAEGGEGKQGGGGDSAPVAYTVQYIYIESIYTLHWYTIPKYVRAEHINYASKFSTNTPKKFA